MIKNLYRSSCKVSVIVRFYETGIISTNLRKKYSDIKFHENPLS